MCRLMMDLLVFVNLKSSFLYVSIVKVFEIYWLKNIFLGLVGNNVNFDI